MRMIKIPNCSYATYNLIRNKIMQVIPFALLNQDYSKDEQTAIFNFWDSDYIPDVLRKFIVQPPASRENRELLKAELEKIL